MVVEIGYWPIRGIINPTRLLLEHVGEQYEFKDWATTQPGWFEQKYQLGLPFPNLPYVIDGNVKLTQSGAIIRYLARKHGLVATTEEEQQRQDLVDGVVNDLRNGWSTLCYRSADFETDKVAYRKDRLTPVLAEFDKWFAKNEYVVGSKLTFGDFNVFESIDGHSKLFPDLLDEHPNLKKHHDKIANLKGVKEYLASDRNPKALNGHTAKWGG